MTSLRWHWLGRAEYRRVLADQLVARERVWAGGDGVVYLCEHPPVITLGRSAAVENIIDAGGVPVERIERGGEVTYHGPGQLMIYPIVRIRSVVEFLASVAGAIASACAVLGVHDLAWRRDPAGIWRDGMKVAACGIHVARGVTMHGFALNVDTPDAMWRRIKPCGLDVPQLSMTRAGGRAIRVEDVAIEVGPRVVASLARATPPEIVR
ncbi:MAG: Lipoyl(octanoyl) transferase [Deltaproteobacteria bacterium]|nr:Lipoyl(octanoyl) transferase [Deltaproteobacteria bacterium]